MENDERTELKRPREISFALFHIIPSTTWGEKDDEIYSIIINVEEKPVHIGIPGKRFAELEPDLNLQSKGDIFPNTGEDERKKKFIKLGKGSLDALIYLDDNGDVEYVLLPYEKTRHNIIEKSYDIAASTLKQSQEAETNINDEPHKTSTVSQVKQQYTPFQMVYETIKKKPREKFEFLEEKQEFGFIKMQRGKSAIAIPKSWIPDIIDKFRINNEKI